MLATDYQEHTPIRRFGEEIKRAKHQLPSWGHISKILSKDFLWYMHVLIIEFLENKGIRSITQMLTWFHSRDELTYVNLFLVQK